MNLKPVPLKSIQTFTSKLFKATVYFKQSEAKLLLTSDAKKQLDNAIKQYTEYTTQNITGSNRSALINIDAYTNSDDSNKNNDKLSNDRAQAAKKYLIEHGINSSVINAQGHGESNLVNNKDGEDKAASRRVEISVQPTR